MNPRQQLAAGVEFLKRFLDARGRTGGHVIVEPSDYVLRNAGDMAMLEVAVTRVATMWPDKRILVLSHTPGSFPHYGSNVIPMESRGRREWVAGLSGPAAADFIRDVETADLLLVAGMGGITDAFPEYALGVLATLELAVANGVPTAMMGQGIGPLGPGSVREVAARVLPRVNRIALREQRAGRPLLLELGVAPQHVITTGDDAIEMAFARRPSRLGAALGVNVRAATYSGVDEKDTSRIGEGISRFIGDKRIPLLPLPISRVPGEADADTICTLLANLDPTSDGGRLIQDTRELMERTAMCRVVVTGSYHAGVFALAMGIPVVGLARTSYYSDKFYGLADQFPRGCQVVMLADPNLVVRLAAAIEQAWNGANEHRGALLASATSQIAASQNAYQDLKSLIRQA